MESGFVDTGVHDRRASEVRGHLVADNHGSWKAERGKGLIVIAYKARPTRKGIVAGAVVVKRAIGQALRICTCQVV